MKWGPKLALLFFLAACAPKEKAPTADVSAPPPPEMKTESAENLVPKSARAHLKFQDQKVSGIIHFSQHDTGLKLDVQLEGLKAGPYDLQLASGPHCKKIRGSKIELGQVIAGKNGVVKQIVEQNRPALHELIGKAIALKAKSKHFSETIACGLIEKI